MFYVSGKVPLAWKHAIVTLVYKSGLASTVDNCRPISSTCVPCKLMKRIIVNETPCFMQFNKVITKQQHGFLSGHSTTRNLLEAINDWTLAFNAKKLVSVAYTDFKRAFDHVSHIKLVAKLQSCGISGQLLEWNKSFLDRRSHQTKVSYSLSTVLLDRCYSSYT